MLRGTHRNRVRVRVRSFVTGQVLQYVTESEARVMCAENADGSEMLGQDGRPMEPVARRLSRRKAALTDIKLLARVKSERPSDCTLSQIDAETNAFAQARFNGSGVPLCLAATDSIAALDRAEDKVKAWPLVHDDRAVVICAGKVHGVVKMAAIPEQLINFA
jgi:hypothetical protein